MKLKESSENSLDFLDMEKIDGDIDFKFGFLKREFFNNLFFFSKQELDKNSFIQENNFFGKDN